MFNHNMTESPPSRNRSTRIFDYYYNGHPNTCHTITVAQTLSMRPARRNLSSSLTRPRPYRSSSAP